MPDDIDEMDGDHTQQSHKEDDEFLPSEISSQTKSLARLEDDEEDDDDDEFTASLMAAAKGT